ncbi:MAG: hypothetical protein J7452_00990 [Thermoflexus sp.]|nr:hypothetical protein [Thermoflexus sp.]
MAKKPEWWQMLGSPEKMIERYAFTAAVLIVLIALSLGDIFFNIFEDKILKILTYLVLLALWTHATAERTAREELWEQLKAPRAFFLKDRGAVYRAAAELLQKAREHPAATEIVLTSLRVPRWPGGETFPERERYLQEKMQILREERIPVRHIFNLPDEPSLERLLESEPGMLAKEGKGKAFLVKAFARGDDLPHIDVGAVKGIGVVFAFPDPLQRAWNAAGVRIDDPQIAEMAFRYFQALWEDPRGFLIFDRGDLKEDEIEALRRALRGEREEKIRILDGEEALYQTAGDVVEKSLRIRVYAIGRGAPRSHHVGPYRERVLKRLQEDARVELRRITSADLDEDARKYLSGLAQHPNAALKGYPGEVDAPAILIGDREVVIALGDRPTYELRHGIVIRDEKIAGMFREWFDQVLWVDSSLIPLKELRQVGLLPGALERLEGAARGVEVILDRNRDGAAFRKAREVIEQLAGPEDEILALVTYEGVPASLDQPRPAESERYRQEREAYRRALLDKARQGTAYRRVIAFRHREGRVAPGYVPDPMLDHLREMLKLRSEPGLRDLISLHWGEWRLDVHSFVVIPGKAALISLDRPSGSPAPAEARMDGVLVFYEPPRGDLVRHLEEIWRSI